MQKLGGICCQRSATLWKTSRAGSTEVMTTHQARLDIKSLQLLRVLSSVSLWLSFHCHQSQNLSLLNCLELSTFSLSVMKSLFHYHVVVVVVFTDNNDYCRLHCHFHCQSHFAEVSLPRILFLKDFCNLCKYKLRLNHIIINVAT